MTDTSLYQTASRTLQVKIQIYCFERCNKNLAFKFGRRSHLRLSRVSNCFPFLRLQSSRQSVLRTWKTSSKKKVLDASRNWSKISTSDSHIVDEFGELYFNFQQHVPDLWLLLLKVEEKDAKNELQSPFLRFLVANEHKLPLLLVRRKCRRKGC